MLELSVDNGENTDYEYGNEQTRWYQPCMMEQLKASVREDSDINPKSQLWALHGRRVRLNEGAPTASTTPNDDYEGSMLTTGCSHNPRDALSVSGMAVTI